MGAGVNAIIMSDVLYGIGLAESASSALPCLAITANRGVKARIYLRCVSRIIFFFLKNGQAIMCGSMDAVHSRLTSSLYGAYGCQVSAR